jgi:NFU1 iron-sulfur cluster scaffold homolog, mitochondrial
MSAKIMVQNTPNPNALKFVLNVPVKTEGKVTYKSASECESNPLAKLLFEIPHVAEVFFFDNYITVTQDGLGDWDEIEEKVRGTTLDNIDRHDPNFVTTAKEIKKETQDNPELAKIDAILDRTVRPALQMDGGDLQLVSLEGNVLKINYHGACGSCPSAGLGTMKAIEALIQDNYNPNIIVEMA